MISARTLNGEATELAVDQLRGFDNQSTRSFESTLLEKDDIVTALHINQTSVFPEAEGHVVEILLS